MLNDIHEILKMYAFKRFKMLIQMKIDANQ